MFQHAPQSDSCLYRLMRFPLFLFLAVLSPMDFARAQWTVVDAGASWTFNGAAGAGSSTWEINGETVSTNPSFVYSPAINAVGTHWLQCVLTEVGNYCQLSDDRGGFYSFPKWKGGSYESGGHTFRYNCVHDAAPGNAFYFPASPRYQSMNRFLIP